MNSNDIRNHVDDQINRWIQLRKVKAKISNGGIDFLCLLIANIQKDKSPSWDKVNGNDFQVLQEEAISLIPLALDQVVETIGTRNSIEISSWEIWHSLSKILDKLCFIPKKSGNG